MWWDKKLFKWMRQHCTMNPLGTLNGTWDVTWQLTLHFYLQGPKLIWLLLFCSNFQPVWQSSELILQTGQLKGFFQTNSAYIIKVRSYNMPDFISPSHTVTIRNYLLGEVHSLSFLFSTITWFHSCLWYWFISLFSVKP